MKKQVVLDGSKILSPSDFHDQIVTKLPFPDYYGRNVDALWDCLTWDIEPDFVLIWKKHEVSKSHLGEYFEKLMRVFSRLSEKEPEFELRLE